MEIRNIFLLNALERSNPKLISDYNIVIQSCQNNPEPKMNLNSSTANDEINE
jgi:hypothetical protein